MERLTRTTALVGAAAALLGVAGTANALLLTYDDLVTGSTPASGTPWLTSLITNAGTTGVQMTLTAGVSDPEFVTAIFFSLAPTANLASVVDPATSPDIGLDKCSGASPAGTGPWQLCLGFAPNLHVQAPTSITFTLLGLHESDFVVNGAGWYSVAHIQGVQPCSAWVGAFGGSGSPPTPGTCTSVPEPSTSSLLGIGVLSLVLGAGVTRRRASAQPSV